MNELRLKLEDLEKGTVNEDQIQILNDIAVLEYTGANQETYTGVAAIAHAFVDLESLLKKD